MAQVNFFMTREDENCFLSMIDQRGDSHFIVGDSYDSTNPTPVSVQELPSWGQRGVIMLTNKNISMFPHCTATSKKETSAAYRFDLFHDAHIEFSRCYFNSGVLVAGRIFAKVGWLENPSDNKVYQSWFSALERWIKKNYKRVENTWWIAPNAVKWSLEGGQLSFGPPLGALVKSLG